VAGVTYLVRWVLVTHHVPDPREVTVAVIGLGHAVYLFLTAVAFYAALEPVVRKRWPWRLVGWNRLLAGRVRDPLVARDVLVGLAVGAGCNLFFNHYLCGPLWDPYLTDLVPFDDLTAVPARVLLRPFHAAALTGVTWFFLVFLVHWGCRNCWLGMAVFSALVLVLFQVWADPKPVTTVLSVVAITVAMQLVALRYGLLSFVVAFAVMTGLLDPGWTLDVGAWYATGPNVFVAALLALTLYAAYTACGGRQRDQRRD
jgi:hypothetical protein